MSEEQVTTAQEEETQDIYSELDNDRCPFCHINLDSKKEDQWVRSYDGRELFLKDVKSLTCSNCGVQVYPQESLDYFEQARTGELPDLESRPYVPDTYDDEDDE